VEKRLRQETGQTDERIMVVSNGFESCWDERGGLARKGLCAVDATFESSRCFQWSGLTALVGRVSNFDAGEDRQYLMLARER